MMNDNEIEGKEEAQKAIRANISTRFQKLDTFEKWAKGTQYEGRKNWWDDSVPLWERAPCVVYKVVELAARSNIDLCLGESRYPTFSSKQSEEEQQLEGGLSVEQSEVLDRFIREYHRVSRFSRTFRGAFYNAEISGSAAVIYGVRNGKPFGDVVPSKWCNPSFGPDGEVISLEIRYPYTEEVKKADGKKKLVAKLYRRVIDTKSDTEFHPAPADKNGSEPNWVTNTERTAEHNFGFCPVIWYPLLKEATTVNVIDGEPIHKYVTDEIHQHDIARSQWHRGALLSEPQPYEIGVTPGHNPTETGRSALVPSSEHGGDDIMTPEGRARITGAYRDPAAIKPARKKGPGYVWQYPNKDTKVGAFTYPGDALAAQENNARDLRIKLQESLAVIFLDPENIKFAATTSGKALQAIKQKQTDRCDQFREDLEDAFLEPSIQMQLRITQTILARKQRLRVPGAQAVAEILNQYADSGSWEGPTLVTKWGPYYRQDANEMRALIGMIREAYGGGKIGPPMITTRLAVERLSEIFGIENVGAVVQELENDERKDRQTGTEEGDGQDGGGPERESDGEGPDSSTEAGDE